MLSASRIRVVVGDDHEVVRQGVAQLMRRDHRITLVGEATTFPELVSAVHEVRPDVAVVDLRMPGGQAQATIAQLREQTPATAIVAYTAFEDPDVARDVLRSGAQGYVLKSGRADTLVRAIHAVAAGLTFVDEALPSSTRGLSRRELDVLRLLARGMTRGEIAAVLQIGARSVDTYRQRLMTKMRATSRTDLVTNAIEMGLVDTRRPRTDIPPLRDRPVA